MALWIGIFVFVEASVFVFAHSLCKSSAKADREFDQAFAKEFERELQTPPASTASQFS